MNDTKTGKTLTLKPKTAQAPRKKADAGEPRQRSGARARVAAQREREQNKAAPEPRQTAGGAPARRDTESNEPRKPRTAGSARPDRQSAQPATGAGAAPQRRASRPDQTREPATGAGAAPQRRASRPDKAPEPRQFSPAGEARAVTIESRPRSGRRPGASPREARQYRIFASCPHGLEEALAAELQALGFDDAAQARAGCRFTSDWTGVLRANLYSRLATRILVQLAWAPVQNEDDILELAQSTQWEEWFGPEQTLRVDTSAIRSPMQSLQYCNLRVKDGICDRLRDREGARPDIDTVRPDARVHLFLDETSATLYLDTSGESLFKRGWRLDKGEAPLRENLAAGLLALSAWDPSAALLDPFCGSGTILIEAAWIALGIPPGIWRPFGFERLRYHNARHWRDLKEDARSHIASQLETPLVGCDVDARAIEAARANMQRAWLTPDAIRFEVADARNFPPPAPQGWIVTNPPYGERMPEDTTLWADWAQNLKQHYSGWRVNIISSDHDLPRHMRLKPLRRYPLHNGALDCRLFSLEMVQASYRQK